MTPTIRWLIAKAESEGHFISHADGVVLRAELAALQDGTRARIASEQLAALIVTPADEAPGEWMRWGDSKPEEHFARMAVRLADALLAELAKPVEPAP